MRREVRLSADAEADVVSILVQSEISFGAAARTRYEALIRAVLKDIGEDAQRPGVRERDDLGPGVMVYHFSHSRQRARALGAAIRRPRHLLVFRLVDPDLVDVGRILHDSMDFIRHLPAEHRSG